MMDVIFFLAASMSEVNRTSWDVDKSARETWLSALFGPAS